MGTEAELARAALAVVFTVAGVAKLLDLPGTRRTLIAFGIPARLAPSFGTLLPIAELATALALVVPASARWGGVAALALLIAFMAGISNVLAQGRAPDCNCFGQIAATPVSWRTLVRNAALALLAVVVIAGGPGRSLLAWIDSRSTLETLAVVLALMVVAGVVVALGLRRAIQSSEAALDRIRRDVGLIPPGLPIGLRAPYFDLPDVHGGRANLGSLLELGRPVMLVFIGPDCGPCIRLLPELGRWHAAMSRQLTFVVVSNGVREPERVARELRTAGEFVGLVQNRQEIADHYRVRATPTGILIAPDGRIASAMAAGPDEIEALVRLALKGDVARTLLDHAVPQEA